MKLQVKLCLLFLSCLLGSECAFSYTFDEYCLKTIKFSSKSEKHENMAPIKAIFREFTASNQNSPSTFWGRTKYCSVVKSWLSSVSKLNLTGENQPRKYLITKLNALEDLYSDGLLSRVTELDLSNNDIRKVKNLASFTRLVHLNLANNPRIEDLTLIKNLGLVKLNLENTRLVNWDSVKYFDDLVSLNLGNNVLTNIDFLKDLDNLRILRLENNQIKDIDLLPKKRIREIYLDDNLVEKIPKNILHDAKKLKVLSVKNNKITGFNTFGSRRKCKAKLRLDLSGNDTISEKDPMAVRIFGYLVTWPLVDLKTHDYPTEDTVKDLILHNQLKLKDIRKKEKREFRSELYKYLEMAVVLKADNTLRNLISQYKDDLNKTDAEVKELLDDHNRFGNTLLITAVKLGTLYYDTVKTLVALGATIDKKDKNKYYSPLSYSLGLGSFDISHFLLKSGHIPNRSRIYGTTIDSDSEKLLSHAEAEYNNQLSLGILVNRNYTRGFTLPNRLSQSAGNVNGKLKECITRLANLDQLITSVPVDQRFIDEFNMQCTNLFDEIDLSLRDLRLELNSISRSYAHLQGDSVYEATRIFDAQRKSSFLLPRERELINTPNSNYDIFYRSFSRTFENILIEASILHNMSLIQGDFPNSNSAKAVSLIGKATSSGLSYIPILGPGIGLLVNFSSNRAAKWLNETEMKKIKNELRSKSSLTSSFQEIFILTKMVSIQLLENLSLSGIQYSSPEEAVADVNKMIYYFFEKLSSGTIPLDPQGDRLAELISENIIIYRSYGMPKKSRFRAKVLDMTSEFVEFATDVDSIRKAF